MAVIVHSPHSIGRLTRRSDVRIHVDGRQAFSRLKRLIQRAQYHIIIQMFIWKDDPTGRWMAQLLLEAANRGVHVDITKEAVGDFFEFRGDFAGTRESKEPLWKAFWNHPNIRVTHISTKDHAKVFVIDDHTLLLSGMNIADEYRYDWHDYLVELRGSMFVEEFLAIHPLTRSAGQSIQLVMNRGNRSDMRAVTMGLIHEARSSIVIEHCYVFDDPVTDALIAASRRGVRITIILPKRVDFRQHANVYFMGRLLSEGGRGNVKIFLYPRMTHAKLMLIDHETAFIGSANLYTASIDQMGEVNVLIRNRPLTLWKLREVLRQDILISRPIHSPPSMLWLARWLALLGL